MGMRERRTGKGCGGEKDRKASTKDIDEIIARGYNLVT